VRDSHAANDDKLFRWDTPPEGGHPGQAHNCRCYAEPVAPGSQSGVILADFAPAANSFPGGSGTVRRLANGLLARSPAGLAAYAALEASNRLQAFTRAANEQRVRDAAAVLGADLGTVEGLLAAQAYAQAKELAENGFLSDAPERGDRARIIAEAIGLYEMYQPGRFTLSGDNAMQAVTLAQRLAASALAALDAGRLKVSDDILAQGWVEVFPDLTEDERRLDDRIRHVYESTNLPRRGHPAVSPASPVPPEGTSGLRRYSGRFSAATPAGGRPPLCPAFDLRQSHVTSLVSA
jgi:hypothetical protein